MKHLFKYTFLIAVAGILITACRKNNVISIGVTDVAAIGKITSYDFIARSPSLDTLKMLIDKAGMKDEINGPNITFFAPTDVGISSFLAARTTWLQTKRNNENIKYTLDSIPTDSIKYYLRQHIFKGILSKENMKKTPLKDTLSNITGTLPMYFLFTQNFTTTVGVVTSTTQQIRLTRVYGLPDDQIPTGTTNPDPDITGSVQTSQVRTASNMIQVLFTNVQLGFNK